MPNIWLDTLLTFDDTLTQIEVCLDILKENADIADFTDTNIINQYSSNVIFMKQFFERAEFLARDGFNVN